MATLTLVCGMSGSGKSTFAEKYAIEHKALYLPVDNFYDAYCGKNKHNHEFEVWMSYFSAIHVAMQDGLDVVLETNALTFVDRAQFPLWFSKFDHYVLIWMETAYNTCLKNNNHRERVIPLTSMQKMWNQIEPISLRDEKYWNTILIEINHGNNFIWEEVKFVEMD